jgi:hypothetical protein
VLSVASLAAMKSTNSRARARFVALLIPIWWLACSAQNSQHEEARALLERIARVDLRASFDVRGQQIDALRALQLRDPALHALRDRCVQAHAGLLAAERQQVDARARIERIEDAGQHDPAEVAAIAAQLSSAASALRAAHAALPDCEQQTRQLVLGKDLKE